VRGHEMRRSKRWLATLVAVSAWIAGCYRAAPQPPPTVVVSTAATPDIDREIARAATVNKPLLVVVAESGKSPEDDAILPVVKEKMAAAGSDRFVLAFLDLSASRNRATAARFHVVDTPMLVCLSPKGIIVSRDEKPIPGGLISKRLETMSQQSAQLDAKLARLEAAAKKNARDPQAQLDLADFLSAQQNAREAIPCYEGVAHAATVDGPLRIRARVALSRAHLWIAEGEKARHEAEGLLTEFGPKSPQAQAAGKLMLGLLDARRKHVDLARRELEEAIAAAPDSEYARDAREALANLSAKVK
jgi:hypothetical protein